MEKEKFVAELKDFGAVFLAGFNNDLPTATQALQKTNKILQENPRLIPLLANEENQKQIGEIVNYVESGKGDFFSTIKKVKELGSKLKV